MNQTSLDYAIFIPIRWSRHPYEAAASSQKGRSILDFKAITPGYMRKRNAFVLRRNSKKKVFTLASTSKGTASGSLFEGFGLEAGHDAHDSRRIFHRGPEALP